MLNLTQHCMQQLPRALFVMATLTLSSQVMAARVVESMSEEAIEMRLTPAGGGTVHIIGEGPKVEAKALPPGVATYQKYCHTCHEGGVAGAPKKGDKGAWGPRMAKGMEQTLSNAMKGIKAMPPMGTCMECTKEEIQAAITYMIK